MIASIVSEYFISYWALRQGLVASRASFLDFLVAQNKIKWPWISTCTYVNVPLADFIRF